MRKFGLISLLLVTFVITLAACSNDNGDSAPNSVSNSENLQGGNASATIESPREADPPTITPTPTLLPAATLPPRDHLGHVNAVSTRAIHTIKLGDTMSEIAAQYDVTVVDLANANRHYNFDLISVGDKLYIPPCVLPDE
ncbi:MAG: LysM peptidoglycan-binding domain-containing protein [Chloroflexi bacterium]|nr:LysM peptidoglycan-binding domain-containing protein [Chloroflexota bacterium]